ncbi:MAG: chorismate synthase [Saccharofermentanales bacterium]
MSSIWGNNLKISVFGESHGEAIGVTIDGLPSGFEIDWEKIRAFMQRRTSRGLPWSTKRNEQDIPRVLSGFYQGKTTGTPLCAMIENQDARSADYTSHESIIRPGHADLTAMARYLGYSDPRGGGHFSGRLTAPIVFAGAICMQILEREKISIFGHIEAIGGCHDRRFEAVRIDKSQLAELRRIADKDFPVLNDDIREDMIGQIQMAKERLDSIGGVVECMACGVGAGLGDPIFDSMESRISSILFSIPAVKGVEFGAGFDVAKKMGSENNDIPYFAEPVSAKADQINGLQSAAQQQSVKFSPVIRYKTNNAGGIEGGITNGMPILFRVAFKPTPSIAREQESIDLAAKENIILQIKGRHDPCVVPRAVPVVEAACAIAILDLKM